MKNSRVYIAAIAGVLVLVSVHAQKKKYIHTNSPKAYNPNTFAYLKEMRHVADR